MIKKIILSIQDYSYYLYYDEIFCNGKKKITIVVQFFPPFFRMKYAWEIARFTLKHNIKTLTAASFWSQVPRLGIVSVHSLFPAL